VAVLDCIAARSIFLNYNNKEQQGLALLLFVW